MVLTGQTSGANPSTQALLKKLRRPVLTIKPGRLQYPEDFPLSEYATNLGLLLADRSRYAAPEIESRENSRLMNLLPRRHQPKAVPVFPAAIYIILILLAVHPFNITTRVEAKAQERDVISRQLRSLQKEENAHNLVLTSFQKDNAQLEAATDETAKLQTRLEELDAEVETLVARMYTITEIAVPDTVTLTAVAPLGHDFSVVGIATSHGETLRYARSLKDSPLFDDARMLRVEGAGGANPDSENFVSFQIRVYTPEAEESDEEKARSKQP